MSRTWLYCLDRVTQCYAGRPVLQIDRLEVLPGEVLCLVGPVGAGKSTLLRLLAGLEPPTAGELHFEEFRLDGRELPLEASHRLSLVFQRPLLLAGSVRANIEYGLRLRGLSPRDPQVQRLMDQLGLGPLASRPCRTLSGGETQLVALARALVLEPEVLLLDEPTAHLDPARVALVERAVLDFQGPRGATVVWATHHLFQARRVARRVALLLDGRLIEVAPAEEFFTAPRDPRTAAFVKGEIIY